MWKRTLFLAVLLADLAGCGGLQQINLKTGAGGEVRPDDYRTSLQAGPELKFDNGSAVSLTYRNRLTDMEPDTMEHGFFLSTSIPIWRAK